MPKKFLQSFFPNREKSYSEVVEEAPQINCQEDAFKLIPEAIVVVNSESRLLYINPKAEKMLGCRLRSVMGKNYNNIFLLLDPSTKRLIQDFTGSQLNDNTGEVVARECLIKLAENQSFPVRLTIMLMPMDDGKHNYLLVLKNITERKALESKLSDIESYDSLTRLLNRKAFDAAVKQLMDNIHKHDSKHVLAYFSIDQFQAMNDMIGHSAGDALIESMAGIIKSYIRHNLDVIGRVSGNQFAVVFGESTVLYATSAIKNILKDVEAYRFTSRGQPYPITMSAGFVIIDGKSTSSTRVISEANRACNLMSSRGGGAICAYHAENAELKKLEGNIEWIRILKKALQENQFFMHAQPIHPLSSEEYKKPFHHYELLLRLCDDKGTPISPVEFIPAAEYYSMMPTLDRWVVKHALKKLSVIPDQYPLPVFAINLSGQTLNDPSFLAFVQNEIKISAVNPKMLCFEITEQVAVEDLTLVNKFIASLKALGTQFSLDDFGTGVSSYGYLRSLDVDYLKIDGSFVKNITNDKIAKAMVQSINQIGHTMELKVIAEYVENRDILESLNDMGVDYGQGYHISRPVPLEDVLRQHMVAIRVS